VPTTNSQALLYDIQPGGSNSNMVRGALYTSPKECHRDVTVIGG